MNWLEDIDWIEVGTCIYDGIGLVAFLSAIAGLFLIILPALMP